MQEEKPFDPQAYIDAHMPASACVSAPLPSDPTLQQPPRVTLATFKRGKNNQAEERAVKAYILKNMGDFDITKRTHTAQEKYRMVCFVQANAMHFPISLIVRILRSPWGI
ncbi:hypothetical protein ACFOPX_01635 [Helicobacter baculiformis]|uniref:Uncharacterized protein n=1 Tax=Helicobacter baculiformis TaxID=427351 RepID=A0ABV7ZIY2_9HELI|nr:hypothetical protein [Helicobacter baculiformis]